MGIAPRGATSQRRGESSGRLRTQLGRGPDSSRTCRRRSGRSVMISAHPEPHQRPHLVRVVNRPDVDPASVAPHPVHQQFVHQAHSGVFERHVQHPEARIVRGGLAGAEGHHERSQRSQGIEVNGLGEERMEASAHRIVTAADADAVQRLRPADLLREALLNSGMGPLHLDVEAEVREGLQHLAQRGDLHPLPTERKAVAAVRVKR